MNTTVKTILEGAAGLAALFGVGYLSYHVGKGVARTEYEYELMCRKLDSAGEVSMKDIEPPKRGKFRKLFKILRDGELHIEVKPKGEYNQ